MSTTTPQLSRNVGQEADSITKCRNMLRRLTMLKKAVIRLARHTYPTRRQYPDSMLRCEAAFSRLRAWLQGYHALWESAAFQRLMMDKLQELRALISKGIAQCEPEAKPPQRGGKKTGKGTYRRQSHQAACHAIDQMLRVLEGAFKALKP